MANLGRAWQVPLDIGQPALTRVLKDGKYQPWVDWLDDCPFCYNPTFNAPPPPAPNPGATAQLLQGFPQTRKFPNHQVLNDYGEYVTRMVRPVVAASPAPLPPNPDLNLKSLTLTLTLTPTLTHNPSPNPNPNPNPLP